MVTGNWQFAYVNMDEFIVCMQIYTVLIRRDFYGDLICVYFMFTKLNISNKYK